MEKNDNVLAFNTRGVIKDISYPGGMKTYHIELFESFKGYDVSPIYDDDGYLKVSELWEKHSRLILAENIQLTIF